MLKSGIDGSQQGDENLKTGSCLTPSDQEEVSISSAIDYLTVSFDCPNDKVFKQFLDTIYGDHPYALTELPVRLSAEHYYPMSIRSPSPIRGGFEEKEGNFRGFLQISGKFWERLLLKDQIRVIWNCQHYRCRCSRLDSRLDDWSFNLIPKDEMREAAIRGDKSGFKKFGYAEEIDDGGDKRYRYTFGGRKSESYIRIYNHLWDAEDENGDRVESDRFECEFKGSKAQQVYEMIGDLQRDYEKSNEEWNDELADFFIALVVGQVDFVNKSEKQGKRVNKKDCKRLQFWQVFLQKVGEGIKVHTARKISNLQTRKDWMRRSVAKTLAIFREGMGVSDFNREIERLIAAGIERLSTMDYMMIDELELEKM